jgi:hypothetical protein
MIDVIVDERLLGFPDGPFHGMKLLGNVKAGPRLLDHRDNAAKVSLGSPESLHDVWMGLMNTCLLHVAILSPSKGYGKHPIVGRVSVRIFLAVATAALGHYRPKKFRAKPGGTQFSQSKLLAGPNADECDACRAYVGEYALGDHAYAKGCAARPVGLPAVVMLMMLVVDVRVNMRHLAMDVLMCMTFRNVKPNP